MVCWKYLFGSISVGVIIGFGIAHKLSTFKKNKKYFTDLHHSGVCPRRQLWPSDLERPPDCLCFETKTDQNFEDEMLLIKALRCDVLSKM